MKNLRYTNEEKTGILLSDGDGSHCTFVEPTGEYAALYEQAIAGKFGEIEPYVPPPEPDPQEVAAKEVRSRRNDLLSGSDWSQVADAPVDQAAWATYRQALRDVPKQVGFPESVMWPVKPE